MQTSKRLDRIPPYLFARIDAKIAEAKAKGIDIISLGVGDPDTPTIQTVVNSMHKAIDIRKIMIIRRIMAQKPLEKQVQIG